MKVDSQAVMESQTRSAVYEFGDFRVDATQRRLSLKASGRALPVSARAFDALLYFLEHPGELLDKSTLMAAIWPKVVVEENNLNQHISALRRLLGERPDEHRFIVTVPGRGYRFVAEVRRAADTPLELAGQVSQAAPDKAGTPATPRVGVSSSAAPPKPRTTAIFWAAGAMLLLIAAALGWRLTRPVSQVSNRQAVQAPARSATSIEVVPVYRPRLAILPFKNLSPDPQNAFFADGLHEEIVRTIAERVPSIDVISRTTMMSYGGATPKPLKVVASELKASHLIEGTVLREESRVRLTLQLVDARTDAHIWSQSYDRSLADAITLESQVAAEVAAQLSARLSGTARTAAAPTRDPQAFDLYLKALLALRSFVEPNFDTAFPTIDGLLSQAIARDPGFALAYAQRARARTLLFISSENTSEEFVQRIRTDLDVARRLAPNDPIVLAADGYFLMCENDTAGAMAAYEAAEAAGLSEPEWLIPKAHLLLRRSRVDEMQATLQRMLLLDPADPLVIQFTVYHLVRAGRPLDALHALEYGRTSFPGLYAGWRAYILAGYAGRIDDFRAFVEAHEPVGDAKQLAMNPGFLSDYFSVLRFTHRYAELKSLIERMPLASWHYYNGVDFGPVGETPTAALHGWTNMLLGDRSGAEKDGRVVLEFVAHQTPTSWNRYYLEGLAAEGHAFAGECGPARAAAQRSLGLVSRGDNAVIWSTAAQRTARVYAWCGGRDQAIALLEQLAASSPGIDPAGVARDPLFTVPLGAVPAYAALRDRLENTMRTSGLESVAVTAANALNSLRPGRELL
jgi:TolB-like protein/DNA-binding winged helix-turn-helix (wHTH) protein